MADSSDDPFAEFATPKMSAVESLHAWQEQRRRAREEGLLLLVFLMAATAIMAAGGASVGTGIMAIPIALGSALAGTVVGMLAGGAFGMATWAYASVRWRGAPPLNPPSEMLRGNRWDQMTVWLAFWTAIGIAVGGAVGAGNGVAAWQPQEMQPGPSMPWTWFGAVLGLAVGFLSWLLFRRIVRRTAPEPIERLPTSAASRPPLDPEPPDGVPAEPRLAELSPSMNLTIDDPPTPIPDAIAPQQGRENDRADLPPTMNLTIDDPPPSVPRDLAPQPGPESELADLTGPLDSAELKRRRREKRPRALVIGLTVIFSTLLVGVLLYVVSLVMSPFREAEGLRSAESCHRRGYDSYERGDLDGALAEYTRAIELNPGDSIAYNNRGVVRLRKGDLDGALDDCNKAIELSPHTSGNYVNRGGVRERQGDLEGACADYSRAIGLNSGNAKAYAYRGNARLDQGDFEGAVADTTRALELALDAEPDTYVTRGLALTRLGRDAEAQKDFDRYLKLEPGWRFVLEERIRQAKEARGNGP